MQQVQLRQEAIDGGGILFKPLNLRGRAALGSDSGPGSAGARGLLCKVIEEEAAHGRRLACRTRAADHRRLHPRYGRTGGDVTCSLIGGCDWDSSCARGTCHHGHAGCVGDYSRGTRARIAVPRTLTATPAATPSRSRAHPQRPTPHPPPPSPVEYPAVSQPAVFCRRRRRRFGSCPSIRNRPADRMCAGAWSACAA